MKTFMWDNEFCHISWMIQHKYHAINGKYGDWRDLIMFLESQNISCDVISDDFNNIYGFSVDDETALLILLKFG